MTQEEIIKEYFIANPNRDIKHPEVVDWVTEEYKKRTGSARVCDTACMHCYREYSQMDSFLSEKQQTHIHSRRKEQQQFQRLLHIPVQETFDLVYDRHGPRDRAHVCTCAG